MDLRGYLEALAEVCPLRLEGRVSRVVGLSLEAEGPGLALGGVCEVRTPTGALEAEVVGFRGGRVVLMPLGPLEGVGPGCPVVARSGRAAVRAGEGLLGRVLDGLGRPLDGRPLDGPLEPSPLMRPAPNPLERRRIDRPLDVGVRAINALCTLGRGQRVGIFAGSGVGKSTLLGMIARYARADLNVVALIGERGREVREFLEESLGDGLGRSVVVVATSDQPPLVRVRAAHTAMAIAEHFRDRGREVLLLMDSLTRLAMAQREVGLAVGEPPTTRGYTPSVFGTLSSLLERAGPGKRGSITGVYTVLVEGDDLEEPISDALRAILDGHIVLSRDLAERGHWPPIDPAASLSRVMPQVVDPEHERMAREFRELWSAYRRNEDVVNIGAYARGSNPTLDRALELREGMERFLRQEPGERVGLEASRRELAGLLGR